MNKGIDTEAEFKAMGFGGGADGSFCLVDEMVLKSADDHEDDKEETFTETVGKVMEAVISTTVSESLSNLGFSSPVKETENDVEGISSFKLVPEEEEEEEEEMESERANTPQKPHYDTMAAMAALLPSTVSDAGLQKKIQRLELSESNNNLAGASDNRKVSKTVSEVSEVSMDSVATLSRGIKVKSTPNKSPFQR